MQNLVGLVGLPVGLRSNCRSDDHSEAKWNANAFNSIDRATLFKEVRYRLPQIAAWTECSYGSQPILLLNDRPIYSCCGVQQGDPLGPLGFALVLQPVIEKIKEEVPGLLINVWYLDDGTLCGTEEELAIALSIIETEGPS